MKHSEGFLKVVNDAKSRIREVTVEEARARLAADSQVRLIDVREDDEWQAAHAAGAEHLGKGIIERDIETSVPDKATELILYCGGGYRSALAADVLRQMGYTNVFSMAGGWKAWQEAGGAIESDEQ
ncbi:MAG: glpE [Acidobacteria bacterium]|nr:glpE [Acidobacteriota bacterium]